MEKFVAFSWVEFAPIHNALQRLAIRLGVAFVVDKSTELFNGGIRSIAFLDSAREKKKRKKVIIL
jgi:hypothetical protein